MSKPDFKPDFEIHFNVNDGWEKYKQFIDDLRWFARTHQTALSIPLLPEPPVQTPTSVPPMFDVILDSGIQGRPSLRLRIQRHNLYIIGYRTEHANISEYPWYEFNSADGRHLISEANHWFGCNGSYIQLERYGGRREGIALNQESLRGAIFDLTNPALVGNLDRRAHAMIIMAQMISESARLTPMALDIYNNWSGGNFRPPPHYTDLENNWSHYSTEIRRSDHNPSRPLEHAPGFSNLPITTLLALLMIEHFNPGSIRTLHQATNIETTAGQIVNPSTATIAPTAMIGPSGRALAEIYSVRILKIDNENPGDLYGKITATDSRQSHYIYNRDKGHSEEVYPNGFATLTGPGRVVSASDNFTIDVDLWDHDGDLSPDDSISRGQIAWNAYDFTNTYDRLRETVIGGDYGSAQLRWAVMSNAAEAQMIVILNDGDGEDPANVYGSIHAENTLFGGEITIFAKGSDKYVDVRPNRPIPLERSAVVGPMDATLKVRTDLWDYDSVSSDDKAPNGLVANH